jgi:hypothetical protein
VAFLVAAVAGFAFGAGVQYLGTLTVGSILGTWAWTVSGMSAPWVVLPFVAGMTQERGRRAMAVTGPLFGLLGQRWRVARSWISAGLVVGALCLEPLARGVAGMLNPPPVVWGVEIAIGLAVGIAFAIVISTSRRQREARATLPPAR